MMMLSYNTGSMCSECTFRSHIQEDRSLRIARAEVSDEGVYVCRVENSMAFQEAEARLTVQSILYFILNHEYALFTTGM